MATAPFMWHRPIKSSKWREQQCGSTELFDVVTGLANRIGNTFTVIAPNSAGTV
jgi:hypothetical protein